MTRRYNMPLHIMTGRSGLIWIVSSPPLIIGIDLLNSNELKEIGLPHI
jgi:hypothetical protein